MRILHTSDWHVGRTIRGRSRADEHRAVLAEIAEVAEARDVELVLVAGDLFDLGAPSPESEEIVYEALLRLAEVAPVVCVAGNHDHPRRLQAVAPLLDLGRVTVGALLRPADRGGVVRVGTARGETARISLLPFLSQRYIVRADELMSLARAEQSLAYADRMRAIVDHLTADPTLDEVNVLVGHVMVAGGLLGGGEREVHTVFDYVVPVQVFPGSLSYVALGHLHRPQRVPASCPVWYSGSPLQLDFGEVGERKAVMIVEAEPGLPARVEEVPLRSGRPLVRLIGTLAEIEESAGSLGDAYVRVELREQARAGIAARVRQLIPNAVDVALAQADTVGESPRPRRLGRPAHEVLAEYLQSRGVDDDRLLSLFDELWDAAHAP